MAQWAILRVLKFSNSGKQSKIASHSQITDKEMGRMVWEYKLKILKQFVFREITCLMKHKEMNSHALLLEESLLRSDPDTY